jgi:transcriptional regulator with XRE-family HTH domain
MTTTTALGRWLEAELESRNLTQLTAAGQARIGVGTLGDIIRRGHVPKIETLIRLADFFNTPREKVLRLAAGLPPGRKDPGEDLDDEALVQELLEEFRKVPDEWKEVAIQQVEMFRKLAELPLVRFVGEDPVKEGYPGQADDEE